MCGRSYQVNKMATNLTLKARRNELPDRFIKRFIKKVKKSGIIDEAREKRHYKNLLKNEGKISGEP